MLEQRGQMLLTAALGLAAAGLILGSPGALLAGILLAVGLLGEVMRLRSGLHPMRPPWGLLALLQSHHGAASTEALTVRSHRVDQTVRLQLSLRAEPAFAGMDVRIHAWVTTTGVEVAVRQSSAQVLATRQAVLDVEVVARTAAVHRVLGLRARLVDAMGLASVEVFVPCPYEIAVLPRSLPLEPNRLAETRRRVARAVVGQQPDKVPGQGDELRELREHHSGDPFKHIAWKASARRGRLMTRVFEHQRARSIFVVLDTGASMRDGRIGMSALDQSFDLVHSLAERSARQHVPFGLALVDGRTIDQRPVLEGLVSLRDTAAALLDIRRTVAEDLTPMSDEDLLDAVADYLRAVERVPLPNDAVGHGYVIYRQRTVMAALARLPARERLPARRGPEPSTRADLSILRRFCRAMDLHLPYRAALPGTRRIAGLADGVKRALRARNGPFAILIVSDFRRTQGSHEPLWQACAHARRLGHRVVVIAIRERDDRDLLDVVGDTDDLDTARGLLRADSAARQQLLDELAQGCRSAGAAFFDDPQPTELVGLWTHGW